MNNRKKILALSLLLIILIATTACTKKEETNNVEKVLKQVQTMTIDKNSDTSSLVKTTGTIMAKSQIDVTATTRGTVRNIYFKVGDKVKVNKILASLYDSATLTGLNNAKTNQNNMQSNLVAVERITNEAVRQAKLGIQAANEKIESAEIGLNSAKSNLKNARTLREKGNLDAKNQAIISYNNYLNIITDILDNVNYIINADNTKEQISGIKSVIAAKNKVSLVTAKTQYYKTEKSLLALQKKDATIENITSITNEAYLLFTETKTLLDNTLTVLDNTVSSNNFTDATLALQKSNFTATLNSVVNYQSATKATLQSLQNQTPSYNKEIDTLESAVVVAENRLLSAKTGYENALISFENVKQSKEQQTLASKSSLDGASGQLNLARIQTGDLSIKAPISGEITQKYIELGAEVNPGQKIAQISQTDSVKIEINIPANDIYRIDKDAEVKIGDNLKGKISFINSVADPISKKIKIEIIYDNKNKDLIPGTFVDIFIPTKKHIKTSENSVYIPIKALNVTQNEKIVYILVEGRAKKVLVETGNADGKMIEIVSGLNQDDQLIIDGNKSVEDGEEVKLIQ